MAQPQNWELGDSLKGPSYFIEGDTFKTLYSAEYQQDAEENTLACFSKADECGLSMNNLQ